MEADPGFQVKHGMASSPVDARAPLIEKDFPALAGHDSMVTVRLSEPPSLSVKTDLPPNVLPSRRSIFGPEYTPTPTSATSPRKQEQEEDKMEQDDIEDEDDDDHASPPTERGGSKNLMEELQDSAEEVSTEQDAVVGSEESAVDSEDEDEVNWDKLQKSEDEQAQNDDNVSLLCTASVLT